MHLELTSRATFIIRTSRALDAQGLDWIENHSTESELMNEKEKKEFYIAMCKCCLLAQAMKNCPLCRFNIGLTEKSIEHPIPILLTTQAPSEIFAVPGSC